MAIQIDTEAREAVLVEDAYVRPVMGLDILEPKLLAGRWLQANDTQQIVINDDLLEQDPTFSVGDRISIKVGEQERSYEIVGILSKHLSGARAYITYGGFTKATGRTACGRQVFAVGRKRQRLDAL